MKINDVNFYDFSDNIQNQAALLVSDDVKRSVSKDKKWSWALSELNPRDLCFGSQHSKSGVWHFSLSHYEPVRRCGHGAFRKQISRKDPFSEYLVLVLSDSSTMQAWTLSNAEDTTYIARNGQICGYIKSYWKHFGFTWIRWREKWDFYWNEQYEGTIETGDYLFKNKFFCKSLVKYDTLKLIKEEGTSIPILLAREEDKVSDFLLIPLKIPLAAMGQRFDKPDFVIPRIGPVVCDESLDAAFALNIVFRELFFDLARPDISG